MSVLMRFENGNSNRFVVFEQAFALVNAFLPTVSQLDVPESRGWDSFYTYIPQVLSLLEKCLWPESPRHQTPIRFVQVLSDMGTYMWHAGQFSNGIKALTRAQEILMNEDSGKENSLRSNIYAMLGIMTSFQGVSARGESMEFRLRAIESRRASYNAILPSRRTRDDEIRLWNVQSDMAFAHCQSEDFDKAQELIGICRRQYEKWGPEEEVPFEYAKYHQIMAFCFMSKGQVEESLTAIRTCIRLMKKASNQRHPMTLLMQFNEANLTYFKGDTEKALTISETVCDRRKASLGPLNQFTFESWTMCGRLHYDLKQYDKALYAEF